MSNDELMESLNEACTQRESRQSELGGIVLPVNWPILFDLVYIDGDHSYETVRADIEMYSPHARIICGDDYDVADGVTRAVDEAWTNPPACKAGPFWWVAR